MSIRQILIAAPGWRHGAIATVLLAAGALTQAQTARDVLGAAAIVPLSSEPPAKIFVDPPLAEPLSHGQVVIQYRAENLRIVPVFGPAALAVSPRIGHVHVTVDDATWVWADASGEALDVVGLLPGPHKILIQLESANHQQLDQEAVTFIVPDIRGDGSAGPKTPNEATGASPIHRSENESPAKLIIDPPRAEPLSRGVAFVQYRAENVQIVPVFGPGALAISPRVGHIHVKVDDATWHWADASGNPVIIQGLAPGKHEILIQLVDANHKPLDQNTVEVTVPPAKSKNEAR